MRRDANLDLALRRVKKPRDPRITRNLGNLAAPTIGVAANHSRICIHVPEHDTACPRRVIKPASRERCNMKAVVPINGTTAEFSPNFAKGPIEAFVHRPTSPALIFCTDLLH
jgi:hypothetical protein